MAYEMVSLAFQIWLTAILCYGQGSAVFTEQPGSGPLFLAPFGRQARLRCSVREAYRIEWGVTLPDIMGEQLTDLPGVLDILRAQGIIVESPDNETSLLVINATESTNGTAATCIAINRNNILTRERGIQVQLIFFGCPSTPTNLTVSENGVRSLRISWLFYSVKGVDVQFILTTTNLNLSSARPIEQAGIQEEHYIFTVVNSSSCDVYTFQVTALNAAGSSGPSEILTRSLPLLPDISAVEDSLEHSLVKTADGVTLSVMFQDIASCPEYQVTSYTLVLVDSEGNETRESSAVNSGEITLVVDGLMEDSFYSYYIVATNTIGNSVPMWNNIITTDVQGVSICLVKDTTYSIQCSYITGSNAHGCVYTLVSVVEGVANITGIIDRNSSDGVQIDLPNVGDFVELLVLDWDEENSTHIISIEVKTTLCKSTAATITDIQGVSICLVEDITYSIQCSYITGSDVRGCIYTLVSGVEGVANITGTIDRSNSEGVQRDIPNVGDFVELLVFDWDEENSTHVIKSTEINTTSCKSTAATPPVPTSIISTIIIIITATLVCIVTIITIIIIIIIIIFYSKKKCFTSKISAVSGHPKHKNSRKKGGKNESAVEVHTDNHQAHELSQVHSFEARGHKKSSFTENENYSPQLYAQVGTASTPRIPKKSKALQNYLKTVPILHLSEVHNHEALGHKKSKFYRE